MQTSRWHIRARFGRLGLVLACTVGLAIAAPWTAPSLADEAPAGRTCSEHTLRGDYGLLARGTRAVPPFLGGGTESFIATGIWTFNGDGTFVLRGDAGALKGSVTGVEGTHDDIVGEYEVDANCSGRLQWQPPAPIPPIVYSLVVVDNAKSIQGIVVSPLANMTTVELTRR
jgi:hypothetical protein